MSSAPVCSRCGSRRFEENNGIYECRSCGQQLEGGFQVTTADDDDHYAPGKITRLRPGKTKVSVSRVYRGTKAQRLYLQCWQHVLWKQVWALSASRPVSIPFDELWAVVRDLWTLMLSKIALKAAITDTARTDTEADSGFTDVTDDEIEVETGAESDLTSAPRQRKTSSLSGMPKLVDSVALIYVASMVIQISLPIYRLYDAIISEIIPYIRAVRQVPHEMVSKLPSELQEALDTITIPAPYDIHKAAISLVRRLSSDFKLATPGLNWRIQLFDHMNWLRLPPNIYRIVGTLSEVLNIDYGFTHAIATSKDDHILRRYRLRSSTSAWPEVQLLSLLVIAIKMLVPFASEAVSAHATNVHGVPVDWSKWEVKRNYNDDRKNIDFTTEAVYTAPLQDVDSYLDWYERTWTLDAEALADKKSDLEASILAMFRTEDTMSRGQSNRATSIASALGSPAQDQLVSPSPFRNRPLRPDMAKQYQIFPDIASLGNNNPDNFVYKFHAEAARLACIDIKRFLRSIRHWERRLEADGYETRRAEHIPSQEHNQDYPRESESSTQR